MQGGTFKGSMYEYLMKLSVEIRKKDSWKWETRSKKNAKNHSFRWGNGYG